MARSESLPANVVRFPRKLPARRSSGSAPNHCQVVSLEAQRKPGSPVPDTAADPVIAMRRQIAYLRDALREKDHGMDDATVVKVRVWIHLDWLEEKLDRLAGEARPNL